MVLCLSSGFPALQVKLQVLAILENGASKILPKGSDALRVLLILRDPQEAVQSSARSLSRTSSARVRQRVMSDLSAASA